MLKILLEAIIICLILAIDVSIISFNYGFSKIKILFTSALLVSFINLIAACIGVGISLLCSNLIDEIYLDYLSISLLFGLGIINLVKFFVKKKKEDENLDKNNDYILSPSEAILLSLILIPDGFCASLSCGSDFKFILCFLILFFFTTFLSIFSFSKLGFILSKKIKFNLAWLSPSCLILFSILKLTLLLI